MPIDTQGKREEPYLYIPGSEWTYIKMYCGQSQADELISHYLAPVMRDFVNNAWIEKWFFIRYADPDFHIRIRCLSHNPTHSAAIYNALSIICKTALSDGFGWKVVSDSYDREVSRYGGLLSVVHCEKLFHLDTELIVDFIGSADAQIPVSKRWLFSVFCITTLLEAFNLNLDEKSKLINNLAESFRQEFNFGARQKVQLGAKYRSYRAPLDKLVFGRSMDAESTNQRIEWQAMIHRYQGELVSVATKIKALADSGKLTASLNAIICSLVHMHCNRMFIANQRSHEVVLYDFLDRIQESLLATARAKEKSMLVA